MTSGIYHRRFRATPIRIQKSIKISIHLSHGFLSDPGYFPNQSDTQKIFQSSHSKEQI